MIFFWDAGQDTETPVEALTYNIRIGTAPGLSDVVSPIALLSDGKRKIVRPGNVELNRRWYIGGLLNGTYYWSVQTIDNTYSGSQFSAEQIFVLSGSNNQNFIKINAELPGIVDGEASWGDYDGDGDLDVAASGRSSSEYGYVLTKIFRNDSGTLIDINAQLTGLSQSSIEWGDYDGDGDLDLLNLGIDSSVVNWLIIYKNQGNDIFTKINTELDGFRSGDVEWGDYDNDGDLDFVVCGTYTFGSAKETKIYRNDGNDRFTMMDIQLQTTVGGTSVWGDYDNDGDLDLAIGGGGVHMTRIYNNDKSVGFIDLGVDFTEEKYYKRAGPVQWGDYDSDGDLDLLAERTLFKNNNGIFTKDIVLDVGEFFPSSSKFGDINNDGYLDIIMCGTILGVALPATKLFINNSSSGFIQKQINIAPARSGNVDLGDFNNDGALDVLITGSSDSEPRILSIYKNIGLLPNIRPEPPSTFQANIDSGIVLLSWNRGSDLETDSFGLSYNLKIGLSPEGQSFIPAHANISTGKRYFAEMGNVQENLNWSFESKVSGNYFWAVQSIDNSFAGSAFSEGNQFTLDAIPALDKDTLDFGEVEIGNSKLLKFNIFNDGNINLLIYTFELYSENIYVTPANGVINIGDSNEFSITFNPDEAGVYNGDLILKHNGLKINTLIPIKATALDTLIIPNVLLDQDTLDFGKTEIGKSKLLNFIIFNDGNSQLLINKIELYSDCFSVSPENTVINIGDSSEFSIIFEPDEPGIYNGDIVIQHNGLNLNTLLPIKATALDTTLIPSLYSISQNYPNPFNEGTQINYALREPGWVKLSLFDVLGNNTSVLINELKTVGYHTYDFNSRALASGVYIYRIQVGNFIETKKMLLIK